jgi:hypothetical protein
MKAVCIFDTDGYLHTLVGHEGIFLDKDLNVERSPTVTGDIHRYKEIKTQVESNTINPRFLL